MPPLPPRGKMLSLATAQKMNRAGRRKLGKINKIKIAGTTKPYVKPIE
jgi:hypothetical protein